MSHGAGAVVIVVALRVAVVEAAAIVVVLAGCDHVHCLRLVSRGDPACLVAAVPHAAFKEGGVGAVAADGQRVGRRVDGRVALAVRTGGSGLRAGSGRRAG